MDNHTYSLDTTWRVLLKDLDIAPANVLRRAGLPDDLLHQENVRLVSADFYRLWSGLEAEMADPAMLVRICQAVRSETFSPPIFAAFCSPNLLVAMQRIAKFKPLIAPFRLEISEDAQTVSFDMVWLDDGPRKPATLIMMELMMGVAIARIGTREAICPIEVMTTARVLGTADCEAYLGAPITSSPRNRVTFAKEDVLRPFLTTNECLWQTFEPTLRQRLADLGAETSTAQRVRSALLEGLPSGQTSIEAIAKRLAVSKRTLQRRIEAEGASFQSILAKTRQSLAEHYLRNTVLPVPEISFLLGFEETNSFYRAFRHWTGTTPDTLRSAAA